MDDVIVRIVIPVFSFVDGIPLRLGSFVADRSQTATAIERTIADFGNTIGNCDRG